MPETQQPPQPMRRLPPMQWRPPESLDEGALARLLDHLMPRLTRRPDPGHLERAQRRAAALTDADLRIDQIRRKLSGIAARVRRASQTGYDGLSPAEHTRLVERGAELAAAAGALIDDGLVAALREPYSEAPNPASAADAYALDRPQVEEEIRALTRLGHPFVEHSSDRIAIGLVTPPARIRKLDFGPFVLRWNVDGYLAGRDVDFSAAAVHPLPSGSYVHPVVAAYGHDVSGRSRGGSLCVGQGRAAMRNLARLGQVFQLFEMAVTVLNTDPAGNTPHRPLDTWSQLQALAAVGAAACVDCDEPTEGRCTICQSALCDDCRTLCSGCLERTCPSCQEACGRCGRMRCRSCAAPAVDRCTCRS